MTHSHSFVLKEALKKEALKKHMVKENKVGYIMEEMPLDKSFKEEVARMYFEDIAKDIDNHHEVKERILKNPEKFDKDIIKLFYETEGIIEKLSNEDVVFKINKSDFCGDKDKNLLTTYCDIIKFLHKKNSNSIKPLIDNLARRIYGDKNAYWCLNYLGDLVRAAYYRIRLIDRKLIDESEMSNLGEFAENLENREDYVIDIIRESTRKEKCCS